MLNPLFNQLSEQLQLAVGGSEPLRSGRGTRFRGARFTRITVYHANVAVGNSAEVAIHTPSLAESTGMLEADIRHQIDQLRASTGCEINFNLQKRWPRIGVRTAEHARVVIAFIVNMRDRARARR